MSAARIAHYTIIERLGAGGMGEVYRARDEVLGRDIALKVLLPGAVADETARARFLREARTASALNHPHVAQIYEVGEADGRCYIAMELVEGKTLRDLIPERGLPIESVIRYGAQIADALAQAHDKGIVHRDLKSGNIVITPDGRAKVLDFGLAKRIDDEPDEGHGGLADEDLTITKSGMLVGTPAYLAPEVLSGAKLESRSDLWALGVVLHEMASGALPFGGRTVLEVSRSIVNDPPAPLPPRVPPGLRSVIVRLLAKEPGRRYQYASEVRSALQALEVDSATALPKHHARGKGKMIFAWGTGVVAAALLCVALFESGLVGGGGRALPPPPGSRGKGALPSPPGTPSAAQRIRSLAVLPLANLSGDASQDYFADGMTEELITRLAPIGSLKVISRTSVMRYKGTQKSIQEIGRELKVDGIVEGSVLRSGDRVRITAQLIDAGEDRHLWAQSYDRDAKDVLELQREVAVDIARQIQLELTPQEHAMMEQTRAQNPEAYEAYLKARFHWNKITDEGVRKSIEYFEQAIALDPKDPRYYAGLSNAYLIRGQLLESMPFSEAMPKVRDYAQRALALDDASAEAHTSMGAALLFADWDWKGAEPHLKRAIELSPSFALGHLVYAVFLSAQGRSDDAIATCRRARELDPLSLIINWELASELALARRYDEAFEQAKRTLEIDPTSVLPRNLIVGLHELKGDYPAALEAMDTYFKGEEDIKLLAAKRRAAYATAGKRGYWQATLDFALAQGAATGISPQKSAGISPQQLAGLYVRVGDHEKAFAYLEQAFEARSGDLLFLKVSPDFDPLHGDRRFDDLLRRIGLPPVT